MESIIKMLVTENRKTAPEDVDKVYAKIVHSLVREEYPQDRMESITNNYLDDPTNSEYADAFKQMQAYRKLCKQKARKLLGMEE